MFSCFGLFWCSPGMTNELDRDDLISSEIQNDGIHCYYQEPLEEDCGTILIRKVIFESRNDS